MFLGEIYWAAQHLRQGGVVAFPTETVYGLGADAFNPMAVARVFEVKGRPHFDPLIVHIEHVDQLARLTSRVPPWALLLAERFWPGPLTLVLPRAGRVPDLVTAGLPTVAVRLPDHPVALRLIRETGSPIAAPSANLFGQVSPVTAAHVRDQLGGLVDVVLDGGACRVGVESTILSLVTPRPTLLRPGGVPLEEIEKIIGPVHCPASTAGAPNRPLAPGCLPSHYAPRTRLWLRQPPGASPVQGRVGLLTLQQNPTRDQGFAVVEELSPSASLREAAANLYSALRKLDKLGLDAILADLVPEHGLGLAINDRLRRASAHL